jgi:preprotein translocase subunit SecE
MIAKIKQIPQFFREVREEVKKVNWSTRQELRDITIMVLVVSVILTVYIAAIDEGFSRMIQMMIKR